MTTARNAARNAAEPRLAAYLSAVGAGLHGPRSRRARILAELRDGLEDAVADQARDGLAPDQVTDAALDGFGTPTEVAAAFAGELAVAHARRTLSWFISAAPSSASGGCCCCSRSHGVPACSRCSPRSRSCR
jgi:hypothetical protein